MLTPAMLDSSRPARHSASRTRRTALQGPAHQTRLPRPETVCVARHMPAPAAATGPSSSRTPPSG